MSSSIASNALDSLLFPILGSVIDPSAQRSLLALEALNHAELVDGKLTLSLVFGYPCEAVQQTLTSQLTAALMVLPEVSSVLIEIEWAVPVYAGVSAATGIDAAAGNNAAGAQAKKTIANVRNVIAVASGKGGVGKSTTTVNLALALARLGAKVGILDADIYGPSQPLMLGTANRRPEVRDQKAMIPVESYGVQSMSMAYLLTEKTPAVWRGPMATGALQQLIFQTDWGDLDYLFVDMPPGTGDIQLTLAQQVPVSGAVIVTTPQDIALLDAKKAIEMFAKVNIPILGVVENMAVHHCSHCGHEEHIFGEGGGERIASDYHSRLLGALPLALSIREDAEGGKPSVVADPDSAIATSYIQTAQNIAAELWAQQVLDSETVEVVVSDD